MKCEMDLFRDPTREKIDFYLGKNNNNKKMEKQQNAQFFMRIRPFGEPFQISLKE